MANGIEKKPLQLFLIIFLIINGLLFLFKNQLPGWHINPGVTLMGNLILFFGTVLSFLLFRKGLGQTSSYGFIRMVYSGILLKMAICIVAVLVYALTETGKVNKGAILLSFCFYFIYSFAEVKILTGLSKLQKNG
jgi:hypothetical protein